MVGLAGLARQARPAVNFGRVDWKPGFTAYRAGWFAQLRCFVNMIMSNEKPSRADLLRLGDQIQSILVDYTRKYIAITYDDCDVPETYKLLEKLKELIFVLDIATNDVRRCAEELNNAIASCVEHDDLIEQILYQVPGIVASTVFGASTARFESRRYSLTRANRADIETLRLV
jgi:hypothetical protein